MTTPEKQVKKIIDEGSGPRRNVIVQMSSDEAAQRRLITVAAEVHRRRNLSLSARDVLPAPQDKLLALQGSIGRPRSAGARRTLNNADTSLAIQLGTVLGEVTREVLRQSGLAALTPLLDNDLVQRALAAVSKTGDSPASRPTGFWTSKSLVLDLPKDDLAKLPKEVAQIESVFPNRTLRLPRLVEAKNLPPIVEEEKTCAWGLNKIGALATWGAYGARGKGVKVAVLDTGVDATHPDLSGKVKGWAEFDDQGFPVPGSVPHDSDQHGTHCAGIIAGGNVSGRWIGVAPEAELYAALVLNRGSGTDAQILAGLEWAVDQKVDIISMSLGGLTLDAEAPDPYSRALVSALAAGIPVITAIGNDGSQTTSTPGNDWFAYAVGATDPFDRSAGFSGGRTHIVRQSRYLRDDQLPLVYSKPEISAPGVAVLSAVPGGKWMAFNGTSMATPHVAGAAALLLSATQIRAKVADAQRAFLLQDLLTGSVEELGESGQDHRFGFGRLDVLRAIGFAWERGY